MAAIDAIEIPKLLFDEGAAPGTPASTNVAIYAKADGLMYSKDDAGAETLMSSGPSGATFTGYQVTWFPPYVDLSAVSSSTDATVDRGQAFPVVLSGPMLVRALLVEVGTSAAGSIQWGLYDVSSSATAATEVATGSAAPGGTGWRAIAASGAPDTVPAGAYYLIVKLPAATAPTLQRAQVRNATALAGSKTPYTWDTTPDVSATGGWTATANPWCVGLLGDINGSTQFGW